MGINSSLAMRSLMRKLRRMVMVLGIMIRVMRRIGIN